MNIKYICNLYYTYRLSHTKLGFGNSTKISLIMLLSGLPIQFFSLHCNTTDKKRKMNGQNMFKVTTELKYSRFDRDSYMIYQNRISNVCTVNKHYIPGFLHAKFLMLIPRKFWRKTQNQGEVRSNSLTNTCYQTAQLPIQ